MTAAFDPLLAIRILLRHEVRFLMVGGMAAAVWGSPTVTNDLDICYARDRSNLEHLSEALHELDASLRGAPDSLPSQLDPRTLQLGDSFTFNTKAGNLDILGTPSGTAGYEDLVRSATSFEIDDGLRVVVTSLSDLIRMKRSAGRPKDLVELEILAALKEERGEA